MVTLMLRGIGQLERNDVDVGLRSEEEKRRVDRPKGENRVEVVVGCLGGLSRMTCWRVPPSMRAGLRTKLRTGSSTGYWVK